MYAGDTVPVIYDPSINGKAYINTFLGLWVPEIAYVIPFSLTLFLIFGMDAIPKKITIKF